MTQSIEDLPGVGPQLAARIRARFKLDTAFFDAARRQDLQAIGDVEGISSRRAVDLVLAVQGHSTDDRFLATPAARRVHDAVMERLLGYASTDTGRNRLRLLRPLPTTEAANRHAAEVVDAKRSVAELDPVAVQKALRQLRPRHTPTPRSIPGRLVIAESDDVHERLHAMGLGRWAAIGTLRDLQSADDYELVVLAYDEGGADTSGQPNVEEVPVDDGAAALCPEAVLSRFMDNRSAVAACAALAERLQRPSVAPEILHLLDEATGNQTTASTDGLRRTVDALRKELDDDLAKRVAACSLSGPALLGAIASGRLPPDLQTAMDAVLKEGARRLRDATGLAVQPFVSGFPLGVDDDVLDNAVAEQASKVRIRNFRDAQRRAKRLAALEDDLWDEVRGWMDWDATFALGRFALDHDLHPATFGAAIQFERSVHLDLAANAASQRIRYHLGADASVAVLTGANSGGKSTLLEHLAQLVLMARMGLPVVGEGVQVPWLDEVHLVTARRGMDAGAFETFLRGFLPVTRGDARRLVLADEVEAATELDAAGRILGWVLDRLADTDSLAVVVTHLADQVLGHVTSAGVRVDGIEATGLDDEHRLVVDRCPVMGRAARSTPELILRRLAATAPAADRQLYQDLLGRFPAPHATSHA